MIEGIEKMPKTGSKAQDQKNKDFAKCFKLIQSLVVVVMFNLDHKNFLRLFFPGMIEAEYQHLKRITEAEQAYED